MKLETKIRIKEYLSLFASVVSALVAALSLLYIMWLFASFMHTLQIEHDLESARMLQQIKELQIK